MNARWPKESGQHEIDVSAGATWVDRGGMMGLLVLTLLAYPTLALKLSDARGGHLLLFHLSYSLFLVGTVALSVRRPGACRIVFGAFRRHLTLSALLASHVVLGIVVVVNIFAKFGVILLLGCTGLGLLYLSILPRAQIDRTLERLLRRSPISFAVVYAALLGGEVYLRFHPQAVGGGGGGNPALRQIYDGLYTKNQLSLRGREISARTPAGTTRILMVGDSFTFGQGVADDETLPASLESRLNAGPAIYEVINGGRPGTNMSDHLRFVRDTGVSLHPQLIIVQFYLNDLEPKFDDAADEGLLESLLTQLARRSYVLFALRYRFDSIREAVAAEQAAASPADHWVEGLAAQIHAKGPGWRSCCKSIDGFLDISRQHDVPIYFVLYPHPGLRSARMREIHTIVRRRIESSGLDVIDLIDLGSRLEPSAQIVCAMDHHPSAAMHRLAAQRIALGLADHWDALRR